MVDYVYGAHDFEAENQDEISFKAGERIIIIERDDQYQDGWWQGENERGQRGLFPQIYTSSKKPSSSEPPSPLTPQNNGTFTSISSVQDTAAQGAVPSISQPTTTAAQGFLQPSSSTTLPSEAPRKDSHGGPPEMRATINDIQNHLDEMHRGNGNGKGNGNGTTSMTTTSATNGTDLLVKPEMIQRHQSIDETSSLASRSIRDDSSSILDREEDDHDNRGVSTGTAIGTSSQAKDMLARNIQLAQEKEDRRRRAEEAEREADRERMRLSGGPPVEGLVLTDESDIEDGDVEDDDDDSIFPTRRRGSTEYETNRQEEEEKEAAGLEQKLSTPDQEETPIVANDIERFPSPPRDRSPQASLSPPSGAGLISPTSATSARATPLLNDDEDESSYPTPALDESKDYSHADHHVSKEVSDSAASNTGELVTKPAEAETSLQEDLSGAGTETTDDVHSAPVESSNAALATPLLDMPGAIPLESAGVEPSDDSNQLAPSPIIDGQTTEDQISTENGDHTDSKRDSEAFVVAKRDTPVDFSSSPESSPIASISPQTTQQHKTSRYSTDAAILPGQDGLLSRVEQAQSQPSPPVASFMPSVDTAAIAGIAAVGGAGAMAMAANKSTSRQSTASANSSSTQPISPNQSTTAGSSRPSSTLGTAFTPATSGTYEPSPKSATFPARAPTLSDPREWSVDEVADWAQRKNFDSHVISKFREHEISGDVLVEMDINTLKEIDIIAFGPRARIARAIKELNAKYYGIPITSPSASYISDLPTTPESFNAPQSAQANFFHQNHPSLTPLTVTPAQSSQASPMTAQSPPSANAGNLQGLGLAESSSGKSSPAVAQETSDGQSAAIPRSATGRTRYTTGDTLDSYNTAEDAEEELAESTTPKEPSVDKMPATMQMPERRRQKSSIGSSVSGAFARHNRQRSSAPSVAESNPGSMDAASEKGVPKSGSRAFFGGGLSRNRKPPPQYQPADAEDNTAGSNLGADKTSPIPRSPSTAPPGNRLSSRFFTFGGSSAPNSPPTNDRAKRNISAPLEASSPQATSPRANDAVTSPSIAQQRQQLSPAANNALPRRDTATHSGSVGPGGVATTQTKQPTQAERIGEPDYSGWLRKKTDKYNAWKDRYLILKGSYLYILKTPTEEKVKGYVNLTGYRFVSDGSVGSGLNEKSKYGFKAIHDTQPNHYFSSSDSVIIRNWMKALMKATIGRDYSAPVTSSSNIKTIPLSVAQAMNPPPRPPSPTSAIKMQKASVKQNPNSLSPQDAAKLMGAQTITPSPSGMVRSNSNNGLQNEKKASPTSPASKPKKTSLLPPLRSSQRKKPLVDSPSSTMLRSASTSSRPGFTEDNRRTSWYEKHSDRNSTYSPKESLGFAQQQQQQQYLSPDFAESPTTFSPVNNSQELMDWVNDHLPVENEPAHSWDAFCSGKLFTRLVEHLGQKSSGITNAQFAQFTPLQPGKTPDMRYIDVLFNCFDFLLDNGIKTEDVSINDLITGNEPHIIKLASIIRSHYE